jgi:outer membrane protein TolC
MLLRPLRDARHSLLAIFFAGTVLSACTVAPTPLTHTQLNEIAVTNSIRVTADQEPVQVAISLHEAMARALKYNLDHKVEMMQTQLRITDLQLAHYSLLPNAVVSSGYSARNNDVSTGERNLTTGVETLPRTTSHDRATAVADMTFSWNILDFGLSYVRARQAADRVLVAEEAKRKVMHRIIEDTRTAYWRAVSSDRMVEKLKALETRTRVAQENARKLSKNRETSPVAALTYERELLEIKRTAQQLQHELSIAKTQLAALMNLSPGASFTLIGNDISAAHPTFDVDAEEMVTVALLNRAELRDVAYQSRINREEAHAALLELLPGLQLYAGGNYDTNSYNLHKEWVNWGAKASWNLLRAFQYPAKRKVIEAQDKLLDARTLALTMAIMTQVHVSRIRYANMTKELTTAREYFDVQTRLVKQMRQEAAADRVSEQTLIREELNTLVAEARRDVAFAGAQTAFANIFASVGLDPYASDVVLGASVKDLAAQVKALWFERGDFGANRKINITAH